MKFLLQRKKAGFDGVFGELSDENNKFLFMTLERQYQDKRGVFFAKIKPGAYTCKRTYRTLVAEPEEKDWFWTYEVMNVKGHTGILLHVGNYSYDSNGCILIGTALGRRSDGGRMLTASKQAFKKFMDMCDGIDEITLVVTGKG